MTPLVIIVADASHGSATMAVLRDWSAMGIVSPFMWVSAEADASGTKRHEATLVAGGLATPTTVAGHLADGGRPPAIRVCALDLLDGLPTLPHASKIVDHLQDASPATEVTRLHAVPTAVGWESPRPLESVAGWHVLILSPEDGYSPRSARDLIGTDGNPMTLPMLTSARLAGLLGLWAGLPDSPLDTQPPPPGTQVTLARTFFRRRDAVRAGYDIRRALTDASTGLPVPRRDGQQMPAVEDERAAALQAADGLLKGHPWVLECERRTPTVGPGKGIGFVRGLGMLLSFVWAAMRNAPRDWLNGVVAQTSTALASTGQKLAFGDNSSYEVVVNGRLATGQLATWGEVDSALDTFGGVFGAPRYTEQSDDLSRLWRDYIDTALTLADGQQRSVTVSQPVIGGRPAVLRTAARIAPSPTASFRDMPPHVSATLGISEIPVGDIGLTENVLKELDSHAQRSVIALDLGRAREDLADWRRSVQLPSYSGRIGQRLVGRMSELRTEIGDLSSALRQLSSSTLDDDGLAARQAALARRIQVTIVITIVALIGLGIAGSQEWLEPSNALLAGCAVLGIAAAIVALLFFLGERELFAMLNRRNQDIAQSQIVAQNLSSAVADLRRVTRAYRQHLAWGLVLGAFLERPFGQTPDPEHAVDLLQGTLPRSVQIGVVAEGARFDSEAAEALASAVYTAGWLTRPWETLLNHLDHYCPASGSDVRGHPERLFADSVNSSGSTLQELADSLKATGVRSDAGDEMWSELEPELLTPRFQQINESILDRTQWAGGLTAVPRALGGDLLQASDETPFDSSSVRPEARSHDTLAVDPVRSRLLATRSGLSHTECLTQLSRPFHWHELMMSSDIVTASTDTNQGDYV